MRAHAITLSAHGSDANHAPVVRSWPMGDEMWLTSVRHHGVSASGAGERGGAPVAPRLFVAVPGGDSWHLRLGTTEDSRRRTELAVVDQSTSFDFRTREPGTIVALHLPQSWLILPTETVRLGIRNLDDSNPLTMFVRNHLVHLGRIAEHHPGVLPELASASTDIVRSLLLTSAQTEARDPVDDLNVRVKAYIDEHLTDADLSAETIVAAHNVSTRKLYADWSSAEGRLTDHIIRRRLDRARDAMIARRYMTIPAIARAHGFSDPTHFTKRFRAAFGVTPSQWRRDNLDS